MKKLFIILSSAALIAGCHSRDGSTGGTYDETRSMSGRTQAPINTSSENDNTKGSGGSSVSGNTSSGNSSSSSSTSATSTNAQPNSSQSQPSNQ